MFTSSVNGRLNPHCALKCSHLLQIFVCKSVFLVAHLCLIMINCAQVSRVPTQLEKVGESACVWFDWFESALFRQATHDIIENMRI